jgi:Zn-dependent peptidase ImmA (M78 family)
VRDVRDVRALAASYGVAVELADLGTWGTSRLVAEYDPDGPVIRINERAIPSGSSCAAREHIDRAIAHELYHHREAIGEVARLRSREEREREADAFAEDLLGPR